MTPERYEELRTFFDALATRELEKNVTLFMDGVITSEETVARTTNLAEIAACIGTCYRALSLKEPKRL